MVTSRQRQSGKTVYVLQPQPIHVISDFQALHQAGVPVAEARIHDRRVPADPRILYVYFGSGKKCNLAGINISSLVIKFLFGSSCVMT
ncbi:hypothetical protein PoB_002144600 [Plakobranchus ocellatus]|uniref:Uncharacterized protein n=1 Tax=Plakobranchus ocellatus TaxID=259542 RepID=A0AAV3Z6J5_9GAST|nr:hypothetical protein PoB_002144600 [Plakobranchus ocellatus]